MIYEFTPPSLHQTIRLGLRPESTSLIVGGAQYHSFDAAGRLLSVFRDGGLYKRGLDGRILEKWRAWKTGQSERIRQDLPDFEKRQILNDVQSTLRSILAGLPAEAPVQVRQRLAALAGWDAGSYAEDEKRYHATYSPVAILPPDQYMALVLQATEGCHYNHCLFCDFYRAQRFRIKPEAEFRSHIDAVRGFLGEGLRLRRTIFLADANALVIPQRRLVGFFRAINEAFEIAPGHLRGKELTRWKAGHPQGMTGIYSFVDAFTGKKKTAEDFGELAGMGLRRVYIGLESGHVPLLEFLRKPGLPGDVTQVVLAAREAGVNVGIIVMLGIGGERYAAGHGANTAQVVNALGLGSGDLVYFSEFVGEPGSEYARVAQSEGIRPLSGPEVHAQAESIRAGLRLGRAGSRNAPKISIYDIREFIY